MLVSMLASTVALTMADDPRGSLAAAIQAWAYGAFTPAGGIFATLTSLGMVGILAPAVAAVGAAVAIDVVILVRSPLRTHRRLCVDVARRRSAVGDLEAHRVRSDAGGV